MSPGHKKQFFFANQENNEKSKNIEIFFINVKLQKSKIYFRFRLKKLDRKNLLSFYDERCLEL